jgi:hypothetical protein
VPFTIWGFHWIDIHKLILVLLDSHLWNIEGEIVFNW